MLAEGFKMALVSTQLHCHTTQSEAVSLAPFKQKRPQEPSSGQKGSLCFCG